MQEAAFRVPKERKMWVRPDSKKVRQYDMDGRYVATHESLCDVGKEFQCSTKAVRVACQTGRPLREFQWRYANGPAEDIRARPVEECYGDNREIVQSFPCVSVAAAAIGSTPKCLWECITLGTTLNNRRYKFADS